MNDEIKFDLDKDIIMQIEMASYAEYNDTLAMMNDHLGEIYGYSNLKDVEEAQLHYEKELAYKAIKELQQENERLKENNSNMQEEMARVWEENERLNLELSGYREAILRDDKLLGLQDIWYVKIINKMKEIKEGKNVSDRD